MKNCSTFLGRKDGTRDKIRNILSEIHGMENLKEKCIVLQLIRESIYLELRDIRNSAYETLDKKET